ncbi:MAG: DUF2232 domain-containing protein [Candidatus Eisenbacteria bacterium]|nr:DUF2232 domain-containing protein [Candidatus Eisenbacteria bacterium]
MQEGRGPLALPKTWALFGAGSALVAGAGAGAFPEMIGRLLVPLVLVFLFREDPLKAVIAASIGVAALFFLTRDGLLACRTALPVGLSGLLLARGLLRGERPGRLVPVAAAPFLLALLAFHFLPGAREARMEEAERAAAATLSLYRGIEKEAPGGELLEETVREVAELAVLLAPATEFLVLLAIVAAAYAIASAALRRSGTPARPIPGFREWRAPFAIVWVFAGGLAGLLAGRTPFREAGANLLLFGSWIYLLQGGAVLAWQFGKRNVPVLVRVLFLAAAVFLVLPIFLLLTVCVGLFDTWFDFRKLEHPPSEAEAP